MIAQRHQLPLRTYDIEHCIISSQHQRRLFTNQLTDLSWIYDSRIEASRNIDHRLSKRFTLLSFLIEPYMLKRRRHFSGIGPQQGFFCGIQVRESARFLPALVAREREATSHAKDTKQLTAINDREKEHGRYAVLLLPFTHLGRHILAMPQRDFSFFAV